MNLLRPLVALALLIALVSFGGSQWDRSFGQQPDASLGDSAASADKSLDRVWIEPARPSRPDSGWYPRAIETRRLRVLEFGPKLFRFVSDETQAKAEELSAQRVIWIERSEMSEFESRGLRLFAEQEYAKALPVLIDAIGKRPPAWRQQWLSMVAAQAAWRSSRSDIALELVAQIDRLPFSPLVAAWMPIQWDSSAANAGALAAAQGRLLSGSPAVQLVGASWLLTSRRGQSTQVLRLLAENKERPNIARLADMLLRRTAVPNEVRDMASRWKADIEAMPLVLQVGPMVMLMRKLEAAGEESQANKLRLSLQLTPPHPHPEIVALAEPKASP